MEVLVPSIGKGVKILLEDVGIVTCTDVIGIIDVFTGSAVVGRYNNPAVVPLPKNPISDPNNEDGVVDGIGVVEAAVVLILTIFVEVLSVEITVVFTGEIVVRDGSNPNFVDVEETITVDVVAIEVLLNIEFVVLDSPAGCAVVIGLVMLDTDLLDEMLEDELKKLIKFDTEVPKG